MSAEESVNANICVKDSGRIEPRRTWTRMNGTKILAIERINMTHGLNMFALMYKDNHVA